jgi:hypothetical protein
MNGSRIIFVLLSTAASISLVACRPAEPGGADAVPPALSPKAAVSIKAESSTAAVENPCGPSDEPCVLLLREFYNFAWGYTHYGWFMDTEGNEFVFQVPRTTPDDTIRKATADDKITPAESLQMKHDSTNLDLRVLAGEVTHTLSLVWTAKEGTLVRTHRPMCPDGGGSRIDAYFFDSVASSWRKVHLQRSSCSAVLEENVSPAAIELVRWVHQRSDELEAHW